MRALHMYSPCAMSRSANPKGSPQESSGSSAAMDCRAKRWPSSTVWESANSPESWRIVVPASRRRVAMATLSSGTGSRPASSKS